MDPTHTCAVQDKPNRSREEVESIAAQEGLVLVPSLNNAGFKYVTKQLLSNTYHAETSDGKNIGNYRNVYEAALGVARYLGPAESHKALAKALSINEAAAVAADTPPMTLEEATRLAAAEGLELLTSDKNKTGFVNVSLVAKATGLGPAGASSAANGAAGPSSSTTRRQFQVTIAGGRSRSKKVEQKGKLMRSLGLYRSAPEAALAFARHLGAEYFTARPDMDAEKEEKRQLQKEHAAAVAERKAARKAAQEAKEAATMHEREAKAAAKQQRAKQQLQEAQALKAARHAEREAEREAKQAAKVEEARQRQAARQAEKDAAAAKKAAELEESKRVRKLQKAAATEAAHQARLQAKREQRQAEKEQRQAAAWQETADVAQVLSALPLAGF